MRKMKDKLGELQKKHNKCWIVIAEEGLAKAASEAGAEQDGDGAGDEVTEKVWEELEISREDMVDEGGLNDLFQETEAEC